jgi:predicted nucleotidyltransferase
MAVSIVGSRSDPEKQCVRFGNTQYRQPSLFFGHAAAIMCIDAALRRGDPAMDTTAVFSRHGIALPHDRIAELCRQYRVVELSVFGSLLREDFGSESDIDFLVVFQDNEYGPWMGQLQRMEEDLSAMLGRAVELVPKESVVQSKNWIRRKHILDSAQVIYGS